MIWFHDSISFVHVEDLFTIQFLAGISHSLLDGLLCCLQELLFLELQLLLDLLPLHIGNEETADEVLDEHLRLVFLGLNLIDELVKRLRLQLCLVECLEG